MGTPPSNIWNNKVDPPLQQDANYRFTSTDRAYIDSQILGTQTLALAASAGKTYFTISQDVTAGGTIDSATSNGIGTIVLTGTPSAPFTYVLPAGPGQYQIVNNSTQQATIQIGSSTIPLPAGDTILVSTDGTNLYSSDGLTASTSNVIFRPGGITSGNVYATAAGIAGALLAANGAIDVYIDNSLGDPTIPYGVTWNFAGAGGLFGLPNFPTLTIEEGGQILDPSFVIYNCNIVCKCITVPSFSFSDYADEPAIALFFAQISLDSTATIQPFQVPTGCALIISCNEGSILDGSEAPSLAMVSLTPTSTLVTSFYQMLAPVPVNLVSGGPGAVLDFTGDGSAFPVPIWTLFTGTVNVTMIGQYPWIANGLVGDQVQLADGTAKLTSGNSVGGVVTGIAAVGLAGGNAGGNYAVGLSFASHANGVESVACCYGVSSGNFSFSAAGGTTGDNFATGLSLGAADGVNSFAVGSTASATGLNSAAFSASTASGSASFACGGSDASFASSFAASAGVAGNDGAVALIGSTCEGENAFGVCGATVPGLNSAGIGPITTTLDAQWAIGSDGGPQTVWNSDGVGTVASLAPQASNGFTWEHPSGSPGVSAVMSFSFFSGGDNLLNFGEEGVAIGTFITNSHGPGTGNAGAPTTLSAQDGDGVSTNGGDLHLSPGGPNGGTGHAGTLFFDNVQTGSGGTFVSYSGTFSVSIPGAGLVQVPYL